MHTSWVRFHDVGVVVEGEVVGGAQILGEALKYKFWIRVLCWIEVL
jgi:hypothetical protein